MFFRRTVIVPLTSGATTMLAPEILAIVSIDLLDVGVLEREVDARRLLDLQHAALGLGDDAAGLLGDEVSAWRQCTSCRSMVTEASMPGSMMMLAFALRGCSPRRRAGRGP
jgi:hypothetical protein